MFYYKMNNYKNYNLTPEKDIKKRKIINKTPSPPRNLNIHQDDYF